MKGKIIRQATLIAIILLTQTLFLTANKEVLLYGNSLAKSKELNRRFAEKGIKTVALTFNEIKNVSIKKGRLLILASDSTLHPDIRFAVDQFVQDGGNVIVAGYRGFDYTPHPVKAVPLVNFKEEETYRVIQQERKARYGSLEKEVIKVIATEGNKSALEFSTREKAMHDMMLELDVENVSTASRSVLTFQAKGSTYMDLLALEIVDRQGKKWYNFTALSDEWEDYAVSFADFIPEQWKDENTPYPLLDPSEIETILMGVNLMTLWREKPMYLALRDICLAEGRNNHYTPTSALKPMKVPFLENDITLPRWLFDPFHQSKPIEGAHLLIGKNSSIKIEPDNQLYNIPEAYIVHPGTRMGTDHSKDYDLREERNQRLISILKTSAEHNMPSQEVARITLHAGGRYKGSFVGAFGIDPSSILKNSHLLDELVESSCTILIKPSIASVKINTTKASTKDELIHPLLTVTIKNPKKRPVKGRLNVSIDNENITVFKDVTLPSSGVATEEIRLPQVQQNFPLHKFKWKIKLETDKGNDILQDSVDVERTMLLAFRHLINIQKQYPDGRLTHHYFGDAYGIRAMLAFLHHIKKQPEYFHRNKDIWETISVDDIENTAYRFFDMLAEKQTPDGALPMGYAEHSRGYNVADGGQMVLAVVQSLQYMEDGERRKKYLDMAFKFAEWAEEFYIDEVRSAELAVTEPEEYKKGNAKPGMYGLGQYGSKRKLTGPSWVGADILAMQIALSTFKEDPRSEVYKEIAQRNIDFYVNAMYSAKGYYQAEALFWAWLYTPDQNLRSKIITNLQTTFIPPLYTGNENEMFELGGRRVLNGLPLLYYQRYIEDDANLRAVLLKYIWTTGSESSCNAIGSVTKAFPKPVHGESLAASKYAALCALWCIEMLQPESTLFINGNQSY